MNLLLISDVRDGIEPPPFDGELAAHLATKRNPAVRRASLTAWALLARGSEMLNVRPLPVVRFGVRGKPEFVGSPLHFSLSHSGEIAVALLSASACGVDIERIRPEVAARLRERCLCAEELRLGLDFFECWTKKECLGKLDGNGIDAHPAKLDSSDARWRDRFHTWHITDASGQPYALSALCISPEPLRVIRI